ncbi:MAG: hypothetical protein IGS48_13025 [Oscillatoriales cyanobacterium C42_A2020_001]|nr:hypothetical protein [Leptolyngbyaceae cyanobacterium C42_A2020_001]
MNSVLHHKSPAPQIVAVLLGLVLLTAPAEAATPGIDLAGATNQEDTPKQPAAMPNQPDSSTPKVPPQAQPSQQSAHRKDSDRVYISDVYPEYCRLYFHRRDWVSLFEYQTIMYRCLYGTDR